jgi:hypothetical protein
MHLTILILRPSSGIIQGVNSNSEVTGTSADK